MATPKNIVSVIIVTFNSQRFIERCIKSVLGSKTENFTIKIIVVDNNSNDKTIKIVEKIRRKRSNILIINNRKNIGFASAVNQGIKNSSKSQYYLLLNPDTTIEKDSINKLLACSEKHNAGICGGKTVNTTGIVNGSYFRFPNIMVGIFDFTNMRKLMINDKWHKYFYYQTDSDIIKKNWFEVDVITGGYMLIKDSTIHKVGYFDESYFMYLEDVDFCKRASNIGIRIIHTELSKIIHVGGGSSNNKDKIRHTSWIKSRKLYFLKHHSFIQNFIIQPLFLIDDILILFMKVFKS